MLSNSYDVDYDMYDGLYLPSANDVLCAHQRPRLAASVLSVRDESLVVWMHLLPGPRVVPDSDVHDEALGDRLYPSRRMVSGAD